MEKIFKIRMKFWLWHSGPLKFAGVGKNFCQGFPLYTFQKIENVLKIKIFVLNQQQVAQRSPLYTFLKIEKSFKIKIFVLNQQEVAQIIWKNVLSSNEVLILVQWPVKISWSWKSFCQGSPLQTFQKIENVLKFKIFVLNQQQLAQIIW